MPRQHGFTLIEMLITMVVIAILAAIAVPSYVDYVRRGKIPEATSNLQAMKTKMEQYYQDNRAYPNACVTGAPAAGQIQIPTLQYFTLACTNIGTAPNQTFTVSAAGGVSGGDQSMVGITFSIDQGNNRQSAVASGSTMDKAGYTGNAGCWVTRKGGTC